MQTFQDQTAMQNGLPTNNVSLNVIINTRPQTGVSQEYAVKAVKSLSYLQIFLGLLAIIFQIWEIINQSIIGFVGTGIWTGVLFIIVGSLGVQSSTTKAICAIISFLVMSIISAVFAAALLISSAFSITYPYYLYEVSLPLAVPIILLLISLTVGVVAIVLSVYACHGLCYSSRTEQGNVLIQGQMQSINSPNGQNQMVVIPMPNMPNVMSTSSPHQLTSAVGGIQTQPPQSPQGEIPTVQAEAASQAPTYLGLTYPPPAYEENNQRSLHRTTV